MPFIDCTYSMVQLCLSNGMWIAPEMSHQDYYETTPTNVFSMDSHLWSGGLGIKSRQKRQNFYGDSLGF